MSVVKPIANSPQIKMGKLFRYSTVGMKPVFRITSEAFDPVDVIPPLWFPFLFADYNMITANRQRNICMPGIGIIQTAWLGVGHNHFNDLFFLSPFYWKHLDFPVPLQNPQDNHFPGSTPATLARSAAPEGAFITFHRFFKRFPKLLFIGATSTYQPGKSLDNGWVGVIPKPQPVSVYTIYKQLYEFPFGHFRQTTGHPYTGLSVTRSTRTGCIPAVTKFPAPLISTLRSPSHTRPKYILFGPVWLEITL